METSRTGWDQIPQINRDLLAPLQATTWWYVILVIGLGAGVARGGRGMGVPNRDGHRTDESSQTHFLGFVYCLVRLLDRRQPLRNVYLRRPAAVEGGMAETDYAHCGADDFHLRPDRNPVRFFSSRPCLAVVLPHSLSQSANHLAGLSLALDVGCHRRLHLCDGEYHLSILALDS